MSYQQQNTYNRPPPHPPYPEQEQYEGHNGASHGQQYQHQYPGQVSYNQYQPVQPYSPTQPYSPSQSYSPAQYNQQFRQPMYNPQQYSPMIGQIPSYNPQAYAQHTHSPSEPTVQATSGPLDDYGYQYPPQSFSPPQAFYTPQMSSPQVSPPHQYNPTHGYEGASPPNIDETWRPTPPLYQTAQSAFPSPPISSPGPTPPAHGTVGRAPSTRHPQARPLPGTPEVDASYFQFTRRDTLTREQAEAMSQEELFSQVENAVMNAGRYSPNHNRTQSQTSAHDDSDPEAAAGLEAMRRDEQREADEARRRSSGTLRSGAYSPRSSQRTSHPLPMPEYPSDSDGFEGVDINSFGGGYDIQFRQAEHPDPLSQQSSRRSHPSQSSSFSPYNLPARVDAGGTGGNYEPRLDGRRPSFDEGDEDIFNGEHLGPFPDEPPDIFYHPTSYRPLPAPPTYQGDWGTSIDTNVKAPPPYAPDGYAVDAQGLTVPRSTSLTSHTVTPLVNTPLRSKTDAEERKKQGVRNSGYSSTFDMTPASASAVALDLPSLAAKRFIPSKLGAPDFKKCEAPWALSAILAWLIEVTTPEQNTELKEAAIIEALVSLFTNKVPTMNIADAESLSARVVEDMYAAGALQVTEEWVKLVPISMSGVIFQLTGTGCYSPTLHDHIVPGRCYAHYCQRTLKKVSVLSNSSRSTETWAEYYKLSKEDLATRDKKEIEKQNVLHEIIQTEDIYMEQLDILRLLYRDSLNSADPSIITPQRKEKFIKDVFGRVDAVKQANEDHLLPQLKYRQEEQGPWIVGFSDIFRQWIRKAKAAYIDYAGAFPGATFTVRQEMERNIQFSQFLDRARLDTRGNRLGWDTYLKAPITRLQRYTLLLSTVLKQMKVDSEEKANLMIAYEELKTVTLECDTRVAEMQCKVDLADLTTKLVLRPGMQTAVELNLNHLGREMIHRGDLQRMGGNKFTWLDSHAILFDHYLVLAKTVTQRSEQGGKLDKYDVSRLPIPMDLLSLESTNEPPVQKSTYVKGITTVTTLSNDPRQLTKTASSQSAPTLQHTNTGQSANSLHTVNSLEGKDTERILYPFRVKHLGRETYTLFAYSETARKDWCSMIIKAKTKHAAALYAQHAEPFRLRVMADSAFMYDQAYNVGPKTVMIMGTPVDRALKEVAIRFKDTGRPGPVCRARANCATSFTTPDGRQMTAIGTDFGVFVSEVDNPRGWTKAITMSRVTQIAVLEEFNAFLMIAEKQLIAYHLDIICPSDRNGPVSSNDSARKAPQKLSGHKDVGFFVTGRMKDRTLLFYKKRENLSSTFKVLEPIYQKSTEKKRGLFKRGNTESFREYDEFYIPTECTGINLFTSSLAVSTARGFEILTLDRKQPASVPDLTPEPVQAIARHLKDQRALGMLRISVQEFLLCYTNCAVYITQHGEVSRSVIMDFVGTAERVSMFGAYIILFDNDFVEIRNAQNGRLKQIIPGRDIKCLDDGGCCTAGNIASTTSTAEQRSVKFVMQHPESERTQIVFELLLNEGMKET